MPYEFEIVEVEPRKLAAVRERLNIRDLAQRIQALLGEVWELLRTNNIPAAGHNIVVYSNSQPGPEGLTFDGLFGVEVDQDIPLDARVWPAETPGGRAVQVTYYGAYTGIPDVHDAIQEWSLDEGQDLAGESWEIYGDWDPDETKLRTDIFYLLR